MISSFYKKYFSLKLNIVNIYIQYEIKETGEINTYNMDITADDNPDKIQ